MNHLMLDLETFGTAPGSVILQVGAVVFDPFAENEPEDFDAVFDFRLSEDEQEKLRMTSSISTFRWWMEQSIQAKLLFARRPTGSVKEMFIELTDFYTKNHVTSVWANDPSFDCILLRELARRAGCMIPWTFRAERSFRTAVSMVSAKTGVTESFHWGVQHNALDDAISQAVVIQRCYKALGLELS